MKATQSPCLILGLGFPAGLALMLCTTALAVAQEPVGVPTAGDSVTFRFVDADLRAVVQSMGRYLTKPIMMGALPAIRVTLETPTAVARGETLSLLRGLAESQHLELVEETAYFRLNALAPPILVAPVPPEPGLTDPVKLFVLRLKHARAADVAATVNLLFGGGGEFAGGRGLSPGTLSDELRRNGGLQERPPAGSPGTGTERRPEHGSALSGPVTIVPDELTNALLVRASREDFEVLTEAVTQLDIRPLQVLIEVLIVEARHDRSFSLGTSLFLPEQSLGDGTVTGSTRPVGQGDLVIRLMKLGRADIDATISASESRGDVRIVSRPILLASNNSEARLLVGSQRPFVQVSRSLPTDAPQRDQVIQYRDVGTRLVVRPTISEDGYVSLYVQQEINAATSEVAFDAPVISTREAVTQVLVRDGQTIVLGGLRDEQRDRNRTGIPILSGLPLIGGLFGTTGRRSSDTELYLFLTPRILRSDEDADRVTQPRLPVEAGVPQ